MADEYNYVLGWLVMVLHLLTGVSGETVYLFTTVRGHVTLPCNNVVYPNCSSTVWNYNRAGTEVELRKIKPNSQRAGKLKVGSGCSLHVSDVSVQDAGVYTCRQYLTDGGSQHVGDAPVDLSVLTFSSSPPATDIKPDTTVTLSCYLYTNDGLRQCPPGISLLWVDEAGRDLQTDSRYQVTQTTLCIITLTVTLQREDINRKWTCQLTNNGKKETSIEFTYMAPDDYSGSTSSTAAQNMSATSSSGIGPFNVAELPISRILLFVSLTIMVAIVTMTTTMRNQLHKSLKPQAEASGIELQVLDE